MKTEQTTIVYTQWDRWTSYDVIKHHMITTDVITSYVVHLSYCEYTIAVCSAFIVKLGVLYFTKNGM